MITVRLVGKGGQMNIADSLGPHKDLTTSVESKTTQIASRFSFSFALHQHFQLSEDRKRASVLQTSFA